MAILLNKVGSLVEVQVDGDSPDIVSRNSFKFDKVGTTGMRVKGVQNFSVDKVYTWAQIIIAGSPCSDYSDFKTKLATVFPEPEGAGSTTLGIGTPLSADDGNGAKIVDDELRLHIANTSGPGLVSTGAQGFLGDKTFNGKLIAGDELHVEDAARFRSQNASGFFSFLSAPALTANRTITIPDGDITLGSTPGIDGVLAVGQVLTDARTIDLNGKDFAFVGNSATGSNNGGTVGFSSPNGGPSGGNGGDLNFIAGNAQAADGLGGNLIIGAGLGNGAGEDGTLTLQARAGNTAQIFLGQQADRLLRFSSTGTGKYHFSDDSEDWFGILDFASLATSDKTYTFPNFSGNVSVLVPAPASAGASGVAGQMAWDSDFVYICIATNTWKRTSLSTW